MTIRPGTTYANLYKMICQVVARATGRRIWTKIGIQSAPIDPYATVYLNNAEGQFFDVVETIELDSPGVNGETLSERVWGTSRLQCSVEFFKDTAQGDTALSSATRFRNSLHLTARWDDLWQICGLIGPIEIIDVSAVFRADTESRSKVMFGLYANISDDPLIGEDIFEIDSQTVTINCEDQVFEKTITAP